MSDQAMEDAADVGKYGTLRLMKANTPDTVVSAFPIDRPELTFGKMESCDVRLYYPWVSNLHCKIIFEERKGFLVVLGTNGVLVDDCPVYPSPTNTSPTTIPLPNNTYIDINKKRFLFSYPPKYLRPIQISGSPTPGSNSNATPARPRRALRMSMIQSARVFSPRGPSNDPHENLRILQTPIRSPAKRVHAQQQENSAAIEEESVILVEGDCPDVRQEGTDLVIVERVHDPDPEAPAFTIPTSQSLQNIQVQSQLRTPQRPAARRQSTAGSLLHRAVLIRSAQRAALKWQEEEQDAEEADEVEREVSPEREMGWHTAVVNDGSVNEEEEWREQQTHSDEEEIGVEYHGEEAEEDVVQRPGPMSTWRRSLEAVKGLVFGSPPKASAELPSDEEDEEYNEEDDHAEEQDITEHSDDEPFRYDENKDNRFTLSNEGGDHMDLDYPVVEDDQAPTATTATNEGQEDAESHQSTAVDPVHPRYNFGAFMTPQATNKRVPPGRVPRHSVAGIGPSAPSGSKALGAPQRVRVTGAWKIQDIELPALPKAGEPQKAEPEGVTDDVAMEVQRDELENHESQATNNTALGAAVGTTSNQGHQGGKEDGRAIFARLQETMDTMRRRSSVGVLARARTTDVHEPYAKNNNGTWARNRMSLSPNKKPSSTFSLFAQDRSNGATERDRRVSAVEEDESENMELRPSEEEMGEEVKERSSRAFKFNHYDDPVIPEGEDAENEEDAKATIGLPPIFLSRMTKPQTPSATRMQVDSPKYTGLKDMFHQRKSRATPVYEGIEEMMNTPAGYKAAPPDEDHGDENATSDEDDTPPIPKTAPLRAASRGRVVQRTPVEATPSGSVADDEQTPADSAGPRRGTGAMTDVPKGAVVRKSRRKVVVDIEEAAIDDSAVPRKRGARSKVVVAEETSATLAEEQEPPPTKTMRGRKAANPIVEEPGGNAALPVVPVTSGDEAPKAKKPSAVKRTRKVKTDDSEVVVEDSSTRATKPTATRTRKATAAASTADSESEVPQPKAPARRTRAKAAAPTVDESSATETMDSGTSTRRGMRRKATAESESDTDPLDSIGPDPVPRTKARRVPVAKTIVDTIAEEPEEDGKKPAPAAATRKKTPRAATGRVKSKSSETDEVDKENTPHTSASSIEDSHTSGAGTGSKTSTRAAGTRKKAAVKAKVAVSELEELSEAPVATRTTRTRTRK